MNKAEMIEDITKIMAKNWFNETITDTAERLVNEGCRIITGDSVVLTNDEWARLRNLEINYDDAYEAYREYAIQNKGLKEENHTLRLENNDLEAQVAQARKEMAKEILSMIDKIPTNDVNELNHLRLLKTNIAKQVGIEVE